MGLDFIKIVGYCRLIRFGQVFTMGKEMDAKIMTEAELENLANWEFILHSVCTVALFFRSVSWKRGGDEPGSK